MSDWTNPYPRWEILTETDVGAIHDAAMTVLEEVGIAILHEPTRELLAAAGLRSDGERVFFDRLLVEELIALAPPSFELRGRNPERNVTVGGDHMVNCPTGGAPFVTDTEGRRKGNVDDYVKLVQMTQAVPQLHCVDSGIVELLDLPVETRHLDMDYLCIRHSDKPYMTVGATKDTARDCIEMASILFGGRAAIERSPGTIAVINPASPLQWDARMLGSATEFALANQPVIVTPFLMAGATAPIGLAGGMAQWVAETLSGIAILQIVRPGTPVVFGGYLHGTDMRTGQPTLGAPETVLGILAGGQLARRYALPYRGGGAWSSSKVVDAQAGYETAMGMWATMLAGTNFVLHAAGMLEASITIDYEKFAMDVEILRMLERLLFPGMPVDAERLAIDTIREVGPGGMYLAAPDTMAHFRDLYASAMSSTEDVDRWRAKGAKDTARVATEAVQRLLDSYVDPGLDPAIDEALRAFMAERKARAGT